ncbi:MAG TPA: tetratricopeptide repeat protein [Burkholderiaceae bacterium]
MRTSCAMLLLAGACTLQACGTLCPPRVTPVATPASEADRYYAEGRAHHAAQRHAEAVKLYKRALLADPSHWQSRNGIAVAYAQRGHRALAMPLWQALLAERPAAAAASVIHNNLGYAWLQAGETVLAQRALCSALSLNPAHTSARANLQALAAASP